MENYIKIPNEIMETLAKTKLSNYEFRYIWVVLRKTLGWNKPSDYISNSQFVKETGIKKYHIWRTEKRLIWRNLITKRSNKLSFNINYGEWRELPIGATITKQGIKVANSGNKVANSGGHKEHSPNETKQRKNDFLSSKDTYKKKGYWQGKPLWQDQNGKWFVIWGKDDFRDFAGNYPENKELWKEVEWRKSNCF